MFESRSIYHSPEVHFAVKDRYEEEGIQSRVFARRSSSSVPMVTPLTTPTLSDRWQPGSTSKREMAPSRTEQSTIAGTGPSSSVASDPRHSGRATEAEALHDELVAVSLRPQSVVGTSRADQRLRWWIPGQLLGLRAPGRDCDHVVFLSCFWPRLRRARHVSYVVGNCIERAANGGRTWASRPLRGWCRLRARSRRGR
jgi:hypothetical protein